MIFITVGSQKFQFNRLLKAVDKLIEEGIIKENVFAQIGYSNYIPKLYPSRNFLEPKEFDSYISKSDSIITHGGTGVIVKSLKEGKKVIAVPRLSQFKEHVDDHQLQIIREFEKVGLIEACYSLEELGIALDNISHRIIKPYLSNTDRIIKSIQEFIDEI